VRLKCLGSIYVKECWCFCPTMAFCCGVATQLHWCTIPFDKNKK